MAQGRLERRLRPRHTRLGSHGLVRTGQVSGTRDTALLATADGSAVELRVVGHASTDPGNERTIEVGAVEWSAASAVAGPVLYFLRARYYDPDSGRFISRDVVELSQRYAYGYNNPLFYLDPNGELGFPKISCDVCGKAATTVTKGAKELAESRAGEVAVYALDVYAIAANEVATGIVAYSTVTGCVGGALSGVGLGSLATGAVGCGAGYVAGLGASKVLRGSAAAASGLSASITCLRSADGNCARATTLAVVGATRKDPLLNLALDVFQFGDDIADLPRSPQPERSLGGRQTAWE